VNNLFVRYKFGEAFPGAPVKKVDEAVLVADRRLQAVIATAPPFSHRALATPRSVSVAG
jgi:hypothetical protein